MKKKGKLFTVCVALAVAAGTLTGCGSVTGGKRIVRISHAQSEEHPEHLGLWHLKSILRKIWAISTKSRSIPMSY